MAYFFASWFHQDYDIFGDTLEQILPNYVERASAKKREEVIADINAVIERYGESNQTLTDAITRIFDPETNIDGCWDGMTMRQWLERVKELIR